MKDLAIPVACVVMMIGAVCGAAAAHADDVEWKELPDLEQPLSGHFAGVSNNALVLAGGAWFPVSLWEGGTKQWLDTVFVLEPDAAAWQAAAPLPHPVAYGAVVSHDNRVICAGGSDGQTHFTEVFALEWADGAIQRTTLPDLPRPCAFMSAALVGSTMYVAGGQEAPDSTEALHSFWALDLAAESPAWQELEPWPGPARILPVVAAQEDSVFVFSGADLAAGPDGTAKRTYLTDGYRFRPKAPGTLHPGWDTVTGPPRPVVAAPALGYGPSHVLVFGGDDGSLVDQIQQLRANHPGFSRDMLAYHTITDTWAVKGSIPHTLVTTQAVLWEKRIVVPAGEDRPGHRSVKVLSGSPPEPAKRLNWLDYSVMIVYFAALIGMGFYFSKREKTTDDFFLGGRRVPWWAAGISIFGTLLSAITFLAVPATSFSGDWVFYIGYLSVFVVAPVVIFIYLPFFRRTRITTAYEYLEKRFNVAVRLFGSLAFILFQLGRVGIVILLPALALRAATGIDVQLAILCMGVLCTIYTVLGGIEAVIWTDVLQVVVLIGGALLSLVLIVGSIDGGVPAIVSTAAASDKFHMFDWGWDITAKVVWVVVLGRVLESIIPYTTDQTVVQRYLTTSSEKEAGKAVLLGSLFSLPNGIIFFGLGTALFVFYKNNPALLTPGLKTDAIFPLFIVQQLPAGISGLIIAAVFAAAMSSLDSSLNSMSTVIVTDFYRRFKRDTTDHGALQLARGLTIFIGILGTGSALIMSQHDIGSLWQHYMKLIGLFGGGLAGIFALGIFTRRATGAGALIGAVVGAVVLLLVQRTHISFLLYSTVGISTSFIVGYAASFVVGRNPANMAGLCWHTRNDGPPRPSTE
ncbi:MAG: sodium/solute symporter [Candidatus Hydrogenedentes bacterium]|nr:sodium/solute symporter [Candidatus Hydrogenedentota bacterium]